MHGTTVEITKPFFKPFRLSFMSVSACLSRALIAKYVLLSTVFAGAKTELNES